MSDCVHIGRGNDYFTYEPTQARFCFECVSAFASWMLDGGVTEDPVQFAWAIPPKKVLD